MSWFSHFLTSSIGQKWVMSLTGLFLIIFLVVHLVGNLQLLADDGGVSFNLYTQFMTTNPLIITTSYLLYAFILIHAIQGILLWRKNKLSRGARGYAVERTHSVTTNPAVSKRMGWLGIIIFVFILIHLYQFWLQMKLGTLEMVMIDGYDEPVKNLFTSVQAVYHNPAFVLFYVISMIVVGLHLWHGFQSAFQTLGLNHRKYTPLIHFIGKLYAVVIPALFALIPIMMYFQ